MGSFERRLSGLQRRTGELSAVAGAAASRPKLAEPSVAPAGTAASTGTADALGHRAAECISELVEAGPGTVIELTVNSAGERSSVAVVWDANGVPSIRGIAAHL